MWAKALAAIGLLPVAFLLQGCDDGSCIWNGDIMIKGCHQTFQSEFWAPWERCIQGCRGCGDECNKLKCAAFCANQIGGECMSNYEELCRNAVNKVPRVSADTCDVECSAAPRRAAGPSGWLMLCMPLLVTLFASSQESSSGGRSQEQSRNGRARTSFLVGAVALAVAATSLAGCCRDPDPQIPDWRPDNDKFNTLARRYSDSGVWRGNSFQRTPPGYINQQQMACTTNGSQCDEWKFREANCHETTFGMCKCLKRSAGGKYCEKWRCKDLEVDQFVCHFVRRCHDDSSSRRRGHRRLQTIQSELDAGDAERLEDDWDLPLEEGTAQSASSPSPTRRLTQTCEWHKECVASPLMMNEALYRTFEAEKTKFQSLGGATRIWAFIAHNPSIWGWAQTQALCIVPGDVDYEQQQRYCHFQAYFREIEEEMSHCDCTQVSGDASHCSKWECMEHKDGMFGVLFEVPTPDMYQILDGILLKKFSCDFHGDGYCSEWSGEMQSWKEADMSKCRCSAKTCESWVCDEYKLMAQRVWYQCGVWYLLLFCMVGVIWCIALAPPPLSYAGIVGLLLVGWMIWHGTGLWGLVFNASLGGACGACAFLTKVGGQSNSEGLKEESTELSMDSD